MMELDAAIGDYLHLIVRTRPWTKKREEALLAAFSGWVYEERDPRAALTWDLLSLAAEYAGERQLINDEQEALLVCVSNLCLWGTRQEMLAQTSGAQHPASPAA